MCVWVCIYVYIYIYYVYEYTYIHADVVTLYVVLKSIKVVDVFRVKWSAFTNPCNNVDVIGVAAYMYIYIYIP